jgi:hypothetical protein
MITSMVGVAIFGCQGFERSTLELEVPDPLNEFFGVSLLRNEGAFGIRKRKHSATKFDYFEGGELRDVARSRYRDECGGEGEAELRAGPGDHLDHHQE